MRTYGHLMQSYKKAQEDLNILQGNSKSQGKNHEDAGV